LPYFLILCMVIHMKTTLMIPDPLMRQLRREAARRKTTISALVEQALRTLLDARPQATSAPELPSFDGGRARVDIANREAGIRGQPGGARASTVPGPASGVGEQSGELVYDLGRFSMSSCVW
jgi:hypothetical protein